FREVKMDGFERRKEQKKENIRRAAIELFQNHGFKKVSISDIAERADVSQVTIYNHFGSKEELIRDVLQWYSLILLARYKSVMESDRPYMEKLEEIVFDKSEIVSQFQGELIQTWMQNDPEMQDFMNNLYTNHVMPIASNFFKEGLQQGHIDNRFSLETIMVYFEIIRQGFFNNPEIAERAQNDPTMMKQLIELMTYGLNG
ncbi:MAG: TetR/AcrR family transcriptional regulator, partial [Dehalococcoidia bacterium]